ncbi:MAG: hypothetical protein HZB76_05530 [Chlamydiae bacterium]|nr:hypothetical protein [Chlamydiota bacterium]
MAINGTSWINRFGGVDVAISTAVGFVVLVGSCALMCANHLSKKYRNDQGKSLQGRVTDSAENSKTDQTSMGMRRRFTAASDGAISGSAGPSSSDAARSDATSQTPAASVTSAMTSSGQIGASQDATAPKAPPALIPAPSSSVARPLPQTESLDQARGSASTDASFLQGDASSINEKDKRAIVILKRYLLKPELTRQDDFSVSCFRLQLNVAFMEELITTNTVANRIKLLHHKLTKPRQEYFLQIMNERQTV